MELGDVILDVAGKVPLLHGNQGFEIVLPDASVHRIGTDRVVARLTIHEWDVVGEFFQGEDQSIVFARAFARGAVELEGSMRALIWSLFSSGSRWNTPFSKIEREAVQDVLSTETQRDYVESIYDDLPELYSLLLDSKTMSYTAGLFDEPLPDIDVLYQEAMTSRHSREEGESFIKQRLQERGADDNCALARAQERKIDLIARKVMAALKPLGISRPRILEVGCGWGALACHLSLEYGCEVVGLTLSRDQEAAARERAADRGAAIEIVRSHYRDYPAQGRFHGVVSVGMLEHVGQLHLTEFAGFVHSALREDGVAVIHNMVSPDAMLLPAFIERYIFPGAYIPAAAELVGAFDQAGLELRHHESWRRDYAQTLMVWESNLWRNRERVQEIFDACCARDPARYEADGRFHFRLWLLYLMSSRSAFQNGTLRVGHSVFVNSRGDDRLAIDFGRNI